MTDTPDLTHIATASPLARKSHTCLICGQLIAIGSRYTRHVVRNNNLLDKTHALRIYKIHNTCPEATEGRSPHDAPAASETPHG